MAMMISLLVMLKGLEQVSDEPQMSIMSVMFTTVIDSTNNLIYLKVLKVSVYRVWME